MTHYDDEWVRMKTELCGLLTIKGSNILNIQDCHFCNKLTVLEFTDPRNTELIMCYVNKMIESVINPDGLVKITPVHQKYIKTMPGEDVCMRCTIVINYDKPGDNHMKYFIYEDHVNVYKLSEKFPFLDFIGNSAPAIPSLLTLTKEKKIKTTNIISLSDDINKELSKLGKSVIENSHTIYAHFCFKRSEDNKDNLFTRIPWEVTEMMVRFMIGNILIMKRKYIETRTISF